MKKQAGFTLIELIMVIVILGILSAFALPRFLDLSNNARSASVQGLAGALKSGASIARSAQLAAGSTVGTSVNLDGSTVTMVNGYPTANAAGILVAAGVTTNDYTISTGGATGGTSITFDPVGVPSTVTDCRVTYTAATAASDNDGTITAPATVTFDTNGC